MILLSSKLATEFPVPFMTTAHLPSCMSKVSQHPLASQIAFMFSNTLLLVSITPLMEKKLGIELID
jgi:hypothetical protein